MGNNNLNISVITITKNNIDGLSRTLNSLSKLDVKPFELIVVDGSFSVDSMKLVNYYSKFLNIIHINSSDSGIYDAMNVGKSYSSGSLIHYLNSGDEVFGDLYSNLYFPCTLPVRIIDDDIFWWDKIKLLGYGYCHQGIIFPLNHEIYDTSFKISADFKLILKTFSRGLPPINPAKNGYVSYYLGGFSSVNSCLTKFEVLKISFLYLSPFKFFIILNLLFISIIIPRKLRRLFSFIFWKKY